MESWCQLPDGGLAPPHCRMGASLLSATWDPHDMAAVSPEQVTQERKAEAAMWCMTWPQNHLSFPYCPIGYVTGSLKVDMATHLQDH